MTPKEELERKIELLTQAIGLMKIELNNKLNKINKLRREKRMLIEKLVLYE